MTAPVAAAKPASVWEDFVDIFYAPSQVFARRREGKFGLALLVYLALSTAVFFAMRPLMQPIFDTMQSQQMAKVRRDNPRVTEEQLRSGFAWQERLTTGPLGAAAAAVGQAATIFVVGLLAWLVAKMFGSAASYGQATMVATYAFFPRLLGSIASAVILYLSPPERAVSLASMSAGPAQLVDGVASPVLAAALMRLDVFLLWGTLVLGIGIAVVGKIPRGRGLAAAAIVWFIASVASVLQAFSASA